MAYQNASPIFTAMLICAAACSCWVVGKLGFQRMKLSLGFCSGKGEGNEVFFRKVQRMKVVDMMVL